jgi:hypothetical protein
MSVCCDWEKLAAFNGNSLDIKNHDKVMIAV